MKLPINCPKCQKPLLNKIINKTLSKKRVELLHKMCIDVNHVFNCFSDMKSDEVLSVILMIDMGSALMANWDLKNKIVYVHHIDMKQPPEIIPFFEPDLLNYDKTIDKIRTYITFS